MPSVLAGFQSDPNPNLRVYYAGWAKLIAGLPKSWKAFETSRTHTSFRSGKKLRRRLDSVAAGTEDESSNTDKVTSSHALCTPSPHAREGSTYKGRALQSLRQKPSRQGEIGRWKDYLVYRQCLLLRGAQDELHRLSPNVRYP